MEKCIRKKSLRSFGRDLISECIESNEKDVILRCSDGEISFHRQVYEEKRCLLLNFISVFFTLKILYRPFVQVPEIIVYVIKCMNSFCKRKKKFISQIITYTFTIYFFKCLTFSIENSFFFCKQFLIPKEACSSKIKSSTLTQKNDQIGTHPLSKILYNPTFNLHYFNSYKNMYYFYFVHISIVLFRKL